MMIDNKYGQFLRSFNLLVCLVFSVTQKWADQTAYSLAGLQCLLTMTTGRAQKTPLLGILYPCPRRNDAIWSLMSILGGKQLRGCSLAALQQLPDLLNTLLPESIYSRQSTEDKQAPFRIRN
uniref:Secreted protein n=1 Tax=Zea mays TaxID=4577 RepID=C0PM31_MAIZE|nr:unknown [Zea mays]